MTGSATATVSFPEPIATYDYAAILDDLLRKISEHDKIKALVAAKGPLGGYLCIARSDGIPLFVLNFGTMALEKAEGRLEFCQEKCRRLAEHPEHMTSWESRDTDNNKWGGAVRGKKYLWAISGLPEQLDEVMSAMLAYYTDDLDLDVAQKLLAANDNEYYAAELMPGSSLWKQAA